jgi:hypothetical protein
MSHMVDFWEVFGRISTDATFVTELKTFPSTYYDVVKDGTALNNTVLDIPGPKYGEVRTVVAKYVKDGPVSLMTLGELLMIFSSPDFRVKLDALAEAIAATKLQVTGQSKLFYTALGCMLLDGVILAAFDAQLFDRFQFAGLSRPEREVLRQLAAPGGMVKRLAGETCQLFWDVGCCDKYAYYVNDVRHHTHPLARPLP